MVAMPAAMAEQTSVIKNLVLPQAMSCWPRKHRADDNSNHRAPFLLSPVCRDQQGG